MVIPPNSEAQLLAFAECMAGKTLRQIAQEHNIVVPQNQLYAKGWTGQLLEIVLGATAISKPEPDFQHIGVELKTLPINRRGIPKETTYVCSINLSKLEANWETSLVKRKLSRVLWVPVEADPNISLGARRIGSAILWSPGKAQETALRRDWEELIEMIAVGELEQITAHHGKYLQIRPKASNAKALCKSINSEGEEAMTLPRGFYLRTHFTKQLLE